MTVAQDLKTFGLPAAVFNKLADNLSAIRAEQHLYDTTTNRDRQEHWSRAMNGAYDLYTPGAVCRESGSHYLAILPLRDSLELAVALDARVPETEPEAYRVSVSAIVLCHSRASNGARRSSGSRAIYSVAKGSRGRSNRPLSHLVSSSARNARRCRQVPLFWVARCR